MALAFLYKRNRLRRQERSASRHPRSSPPPSHSLPTATTPRLEDSQSTLFTKPYQERRNSEPNVLAADVFTPSQVHSRGSLPTRAYTPYDGPADVELPDGSEVGTDEAMMTIPWALGERLLVVLGGRHGWSRNGSALGLETLPPYEERDARRADMSGIAMRGD